MTDQTQTTTPPTKKSKRIHFKFEVDIITLLTAAVALFFMYSTHVQNKANIQKMGDVISKYETQIDKLIQDDKKSFATYKKNLKNAMASLSTEERQVLKHVFTLAEQKK